MHYNFFRTYSLYFAWLLALVMTLGSLYFGEILQWPICHLCWYQRIAIYPFAIILAIAAYREDRSIKVYALPVIFIGLIFAIYQYLMQMIPGFSPIHLCGNGPDCAEAPLKLFGFITLPLLNILGTLAIILLLLIYQGRNNVRT